jgi:hypothetical protein
MIRKALFAVGILMSSALPSFAWWDGGHMVVAQIAYDRLTPKARQRADELVKLGAGPQNNTFVTSSVWADDLKEQGVRFYDTWHYMDAPLYDGAYGKEKPEGDLLWAMSECRRMLLPRPLDARRPGQTPTPVDEAEQARALRFIIHLVGDIHMPLHAVSRFSAETPRGDRGGNEYKIGEQNLHAFWDSAGGLFGERLERPFKPAGQARIREWTQRVIQAYPINRTPEAKNQNFDTWSQESVALARSDVYRTPMNEKPSAEYTARAQDLSMKRIAVAGYRLADLLNGIFDPQTPAN